MPRMNHHDLAAICIAGAFLDVIGSLYLAYDLLGGAHGPLRVLTRAVTYSIVFGIGYGLGLGLIFGVAAGLATGVTISLEMNRASRGGHYSLFWEAVFSTIRGAAFSAGLYPLLGLEFAAAFGVLTTAGSIVVYRFGMRPGMDYSVQRKPRFTRRQFWGTLARTVGYMSTALFCGIFAHRMEHAWMFALRVGIVVALVTGIGISVNPYIEYYADNLPERRMGAFGIGLILCGFLLQSVQYWMALFDVRIR